MNFIKSGDLLVPHLHKMFGQAFDNGELLHTLNEATITLSEKREGPRRGRIL